MRITILSIQRGKWFINLFIYATTTLKSTDSEPEVKYRPINPLDRLPFKAKAKYGLLPDTITIGEIAELRYPKSPRLQDFWVKKLTDVLEQGELCRGQKAEYADIWRPFLALVARDDYKKYLASNNLRPETLETRWVAGGQVAKAPIVDEDDASIQRNLPPETKPYQPRLSITRLAQKVVQGEFKKGSNPTWRQIISLMPVYDDDPDDRKIYLGYHEEKGVINYRSEGSEMKTMKLSDFRDALTLIKKSCKN